MISIIDEVEQAMSQPEAEVAVPRRSQQEQSLSRIEGTVRERVDAVKDSVLHLLSRSTNPKEFGFIHGGAK